jgi:hypothetical protein
MKSFAILILVVLFASPASAGSLAATFDGVLIQGGAPDPLLTTLITSDASTNVSLLDSKGKKLTWFSLTYSGSGTCIVRLMNTTTKASYPPIPVPNGSSYSNVVHKNSLFLNHSGCGGTSTTITGTGNSVIELM